MRHLFTIMITASTLLGQKAIKSNSISKNKIGIDAGVFANYGNSGFEVDGFFELQTRGGIFIETYGINQWNLSSTIINTSVGIMNDFTSNTTMGGGYSNYYEINNRILHELFIGASSNFIAGAIYVGLNSDFPVNYFGLVNLNELFTTSLDVTITTTISNELNQLGFDIFLNLSKTFESGLTAGYILSSERYEDKEELNFSKDGYSKNYTIPIVSQGLFNTIFIGWNFK